MNLMQQNLVEATNQSNEKGISPSIESDNHEQLHNGEHAKEPLQLFDGKAGKSSEDNNIPLSDIFFQYKTSIFLFLNFLVIF